jgi:nickel-type superoxide dismutase maturation protease
VVIVALGLASRRFRRVRVAGDSMLPGFQPGDRLLVGPAACIRPGAVVALEDPRASGRLMVKRVHQVGPTWVEVRGDNQTASTDSRQFGPVPRSKVAGRIVYRYGPARRTGWWPGQERPFSFRPNRAGAPAG